jgi:hypothetical protein
VNPVPIHYFYLDSADGEIGPQSFTDLVDLRSAGVIKDQTLIRDNEHTKWYALSTLISEGSLETGPRFQNHTVVRQANQEVVSASRTNPDRTPNFLFISLLTIGLVVWFVVWVIPTRKQNLAARGGTYNSEQSNSPSGQCLNEDQIRQFESNTGSVPHQVFSFSVKHLDGCRFRVRYQMTVEYPTGPRVVQDDFVRSYTQDVLGR